MMLTLQTPSGLIVSENIHFFLIGENRLLDVWGDEDNDFKRNVASLVMEMERFHKTEIVTVKDDKSLGDMIEKIRSITKEPQWRVIEISDNLALVLKHHPELADEYTDPDSKYYDCPNAVSYRAALHSESGAE